MYTERWTPGTWNSFRSPTFSLGIRPQNVPNVQSPVCDDTNQGEPQPKDDSNSILGETSNQSSSQAAILRRPDPIRQQVQRQVCRFYTCAFSSLLCVSPSMAFEVVLGSLECWRKLDGPWVDAGEKGSATATFVATVCMQKGGTLVWTKAWLYVPFHHELSGPPFQLS